MIQLSYDTWKTRTLDLKLLLLFSLNNVIIAEFLPAKRTQQSTMGKKMSSATHPKKRDRTLTVSQTEKVAEQRIMQYSMQGFQPVNFAT